jgi:hypothetical protein
MTGTKESLQSYNPGTECWLKLVVRMQVVRVYHSSECETRDFRWKFVWFSWKASKNLWWITYILLSSLHNRLWIILCMIQYDIFWAYRPIFWSLFIHFHRTQLCCVHWMVFDNFSDLIKATIMMLISFLQIKHSMLNLHININIFCIGHL